jgi:hypothetical protein
MSKLGGPDQKLENPDKVGLDDLDLDDMDDDGESGPLEMELCNRYYTLLQDPMVRIAISGIVVSEGRISTSKTRQKLKQWLTEINYKPFENSQLQIVTFLNSIWFAGPENLSSEFWWIHKAIIQKLIYICAVAEACNLQQYGITPSKSHLPRSAMFIYDYIASLDESTFVELESEFETLAKTHDDLTQMFMKSFNEAEGSQPKPAGAKKSKSKK